MFGTKIRAVALLALAMAVTGCAGNRTVGERVDDAAITAKVKSQLALDPTAKAYQINVDTANGIVQLNGFVDSTEGRQAAERVARGVDGVTRVQNNLEIKEGDRSLGEAVDDNALTARVKAALAADSNTKAYQINVDVNAGTVALGGFVDTEESKNNASRVARSVQGVKDVENNLQIQR
jgi:hyperosmotically inducible protein